MTHPQCPVHALRVYLERTSHFRQAEQLFICFSGTKGLPVSKQQLSHWIVEAIALAYASKNEAYTPTPQEKRLRHGLGQKVCRFRIFVWQQVGLHNTLLPDFTTWRFHYSHRSFCLCSDVSTAWQLAAACTWLRPPDDQGGFD